MPFIPISNLSSRRLAVRAVRAADLPGLLAINGDPEVTRFLPYATWRSLADATAWLERMEALASSGTGQQLVVMRNEDSRIVGTVLLFRFDEGSARLEIGYVLGRAFWGQGLMHEALGCVCEHAFTALPVRRIEAEVDTDNVASNRLLERLGFAREGTLRQRWVANGVAYDTNFYGCLAEEWQRSTHAARSGAP
jgi:[ribosomal protein S5]-alanine N-acetyltransferase